LVHEHRGRLHAKVDISNAEIETIAVQSYTGKPISVIPVIKISKEDKNGKVKIVELAFSKDFTVGYKNNVGIGTATLIITGIGKYSGEIVTTFNIVEIE
jgi:lactocepin